MHDLVHQQAEVGVYSMVTCSSAKGLGKAELPIMNPKICSWEAVANAELRVFFNHWSKRTRNSITGHGKANAKCSNRDISN